MHQTVPGRSFLRTLVLPILLAALPFASSGQTMAADRIIGTWLRVGGHVELKFEIFRKGDAYFGKLLYASTMYEADGTTPKKDFKNPGAKLRTRSRLHVINLNDLRYEDGAYTSGTLYNPDDGTTYSLNATLRTSLNPAAAGSRRRPRALPLR